MPKGLRDEAIAGQTSSSRLVPILRMRSMQRGKTVSRVRLPLWIHCCFVFFTNCSEVSCCFFFFWLKQFRALESKCTVGSKYLYKFFCFLQRLALLTELQTMPSWSDWKSDQWDETDESSWKWGHKQGQKKWDYEADAPAYLGPFQLPGTFGYLSCEQRRAIHDEFEVSACVRGRGQGSTSKALTLSGKGENLERARQRAMEMLRADAELKESNPDMGAGFVNHGHAKAIAKQQAAHHQQIQDLQRQVLKLQGEMLSCEQSTASTGSLASQAQSSASHADWCYYQTSFLCAQVNQLLSQQTDVLKQHQVALESFKQWVLQKERSMSKKRPLSAAKSSQGKKGSSSSYSSSEDEAEMPAADAKSPKAPSVAATEIADDQTFIAEDLVSFIFFFWVFLVPGRNPRCLLFCLWTSRRWSIFF